MGWREKVPPLLPIISVALAGAILLFSFLYMLGATGLQDSTVSNAMDNAKELPSSSGQPKVDAIIKIVKDRSNYLMEEMGAGVIGCLFSIFQLALSIFVIIKKAILKMWKVWVPASAVLFIFMLTAASLALHVYDNWTACLTVTLNLGSSYGGPGGPRGSVGDLRQIAPGLGKDFDPEACTYYKGTTCSRTAGCNKLGVGFGNFVIVIYGILCLVDAFFLLASSIMVFLIAKKIDVPVDKIKASVMDTAQPTVAPPKPRTSGGSASKAPSARPSAKQSKVSTTGSKK